MTPADFEYLRRLLRERSGLVLPADKARVLARLARIVEPDGYFALGAAETVIGLSDAFRPVVNERGLYTPANGKPVRASAPSLRIVAAVG